MNEQNDLLLEAGRTVITSEDYEGPSYRNNTRDHWSLTHKGSYASLNTEVSLSQETGERVSYATDSGTGVFGENLRSPEVRNTVLDAKAMRQLSWFGDHNLTFGSQFMRTVLNPHFPSKALISLS